MTTAKNTMGGVDFVASSDPCGMCGHNVLLHHEGGCSVWHDDLDLPCPCIETLALAQQQGGAE